MPGPYDWQQSKQAMPWPPQQGRNMANRAPMGAQFHPTARPPMGAGRAGPPPVPLNGMNRNVTPMQGMPRPPMMPEAGMGSRPPGANMAMQQRFQQLQANRPPQDPATLERARAAFGAARAGAPVRAGVPPQQPPV